MNALKAAMVVTTIGTYLTQKTSILVYYALGGKKITKADADEIKHLRRVA